MKWRSLIIKRVALPLRDDCFRGTEITGWPDRVKGE
jgi:hypothetical protein